MERFPFAFSPLSLPLRLAGVRPGTAYVEVGDGRLEVRFGPWHVATALSNVADVELSGPYNPLTGLGVRISVRDRGLTFGTTTSPGLCVTFHEPVTGALPFGLLRHPGLTLTVEDPRGLRRALLDATAAPAPRLLEAVSQPRVAARPVLEPQDDARARRARERSAKKASVARAARRAEAEREHQAELAHRREVRAAKKAAAEQNAPSSSRATSRTPAKRTSQPAKRASSRRPAPRAAAADQG